VLVEGQVSLVLYCLDAAASVWRLIKMSALYPAKNVGIRGIYVYFPRMMVSTGAAVASPRAGLLQLALANHGQTLHATKMKHHTRRKTFT